MTWCSSKYSSTCAVAVPHISRRKRLAAMHLCKQQLCKSLDQTVCPFLCSPEESLFSLGRTWQYSLGLQSCIWKNHQTSETMSDESKVELFSHHAQCHVWRKPKTANQHKHLMLTVKHSGGGLMIWACFAATWTPYGHWSDHELLCIPEYTSILLCIHIFYSHMWGQLSDS